MYVLTENNHFIRFLRTKGEIVFVRLTALWALSESTLGGILHAFKVPLTGIFIGGLAALFLTLIASYSERKSDIIKATFIVLVIKGMISPHTPPAAYFAVLLQGTLAWLLFNPKKGILLPALLLSIISLTYFGLQKIIILIIVFGADIGASFDNFVAYIISMIPGMENSGAAGFSNIIAGIYILIHIAAGIIFGIIAARIPDDIVKRGKYILHNDLDENLPNNHSDLKKKKKGRKKLMPSLIAASLFILILSYFIPHSNFHGNEGLLITILRGIVIILLWYFLAAPYVTLLIKKVLQRSEKKWAGEIAVVSSSIPRIKMIANVCWKKRAGSSEISRLYNFIISLIAGVLFDENK